MTTSELKCQISRQKDGLELTREQQQGLMDAILQLQEDKGIPHEQVIEKYRKKYSNA